MKQSMQVLTSRNTTEWYTPPDIVERARSVLRCIDLDPATSDTPQAWIKARFFFTKKDDGLALPWKIEGRLPSRVWLNPPFNATPKWVSKAIDEFNKGNIAAALILVNSAHGYIWYENLWNEWPVVCLKERVRFVKEDGTVGGRAKKGQTIALVSTGVYLTDFYNAFWNLGRMLYPQNALYASVGSY